MDQHKSYEYLVAYIQSAIIQFTDDDLAEYCRMHLPDYMVPSAFIVLEHFPLNPNGKVDRKALLMIKLKLKDYMALRNQLEKQLIEICQKVLHIKRIGLNYNLFLNKWSLFNTY